MSDAKVELTLANAQRVWLDSLEKIHHLARSSIVGLVNRYELATVA